MKHLARKPAAPRSPHGEDRLREAGAPSGSPRIAEGKRRRALVVDDQPMIRRTMALFLDVRGWEVETAREGAEALDLADRASYDLVLSDLHMPGVGGLELYARLRNSRTRHCRFVFMTAAPPSDHARQAVESMGIACIEKPFRPDELDRVLARAGTASRSQSLTDDTRRG